MSGYGPILEGIVGAASLVRSFTAKKAPAPPAPPTQDVAANNAIAQQDEARRRRGILANIYSGQNLGPAQQPRTSSGMNLG